MKTMFKGYPPLCLLVIPLMLACGSSQNRKVNQSDRRANEGLIAGLQQLAQPKVGEAQVTVAIFGGAELADGDALNESVRVFLDEEIGPIRSHQGRALRPFVVVTRNDATLPLAPDTLETTPQRKAALRPMTHVAFVRYAGPTQPEDRHVRITLRSAALLASSESHLLVDVSTRRVYSAIEWAQWVDGDPKLMNQVVASIEKGPDGLTFFTRGMAKFGLPDLEMYGVPMPTARAASKIFEQGLMRLRSLKKAQVGDEIGGMKLHSCQRDPRAIEAECVRLASPKGGAQ